MKKDSIIVIGVIAVLILLWCIAEIYHEAHTVKSLFVGLWDKI